MYGTAFAAVAVLLRRRDDLEVLLMKRAEREDDPWSAQWSFPGGRRRDGETLLDAACRETEEEVGLAPRRDGLLGCLPGRSPANRPGMLVLPFVFLWDGEDAARPGPEVSEVAWIPIATLLSARGVAAVRIRGLEAKMPAFVVRERVVWGFTYRSIGDLLDALG